MRDQRAAPTTKRLLTVAVMTASLVQPSFAWAAWAGPSPTPSADAASGPPRPAPAPASEPSEPTSASDPPASTGEPSTPQPPPEAVEPEVPPAQTPEPPPPEPQPPKAQTPASRPTPADPADEAEPAADQAAPAGDALPERLPTLQRAAWWTLFGGFVVGTTAGVLAGLSEREEDAAARFASRRDPETNGWLLYDDIADDYETALRRGRAYQRASIGLAAVTGAVVIASATLFIVDAVRRRRSPRQEQAGVRLGSTALEVRF